MLGYRGVYGSIGNNGRLGYTGVDMGKEGYACVYRGTSGIQWFTGLYSVSNELYQTRLTVLRIR